MTSAVFLVVLWVLIPGFLSLCSAEVISCNATQADNQTVYSIFNLPHGLGADCEYTWANSTQYVLAHNKAETPGLVKRNSMKELVILECLNKVIYSLNCVSEGELHTVNCTITCSRNAMFEAPKESSLNWIAAVPTVIIIMGLFLGYIFRRNIARICSCSLHGCFCTTVKMADTDTVAAHDVEVIV